MAYADDVRASSKQTTAEFTYGVTTVAGDDDLISIKVQVDGFIYRTGMAQCTLKYIGSHDILDEVVIVKGGLTGYALLDYGKFIITEVTEDSATGIKTAKGFDRMYLTTVAYDITPSYPITLGDLVDDIATELGIVVATTSFFNDDFSLSADVFENSGLSYRGVLDMIAECAGAFIMFNDDGELEIRQTTANDAIASSDMIEFKIDPVWGQLNSLVLARLPQEDNIIEQDSGSISTYGLFEVKFADNLILDDDRETYITPLFAEIKHLMYSPAKIKTIGLGYYKIGDIVEVTDLDSNTFDIVITSYSVEYGAGLIETIESKAPDKTNTPYDTAGFIGKAIKNTEIKVDKVEGEIILINTDLDENYMTSAEISVLTDQITISVEQNQTEIGDLTDTVDGNVSDIGDLETAVTSLEVGVSGLEVQVEGMGGSNLLLNSSGLRGDLGEWQVLDVDGDPVDADNDGTAVITTPTTENTESGSGFELDEYIIQTVNTIIGESYTLYFLYEDDVEVSITGALTDEEYVTADWTVFKYLFTATSATTTIKILSTVTAVVADIVLKKGDVTGWVQAPNEVYGTNFRFDKEGFSVTSLTDDFKAVLDNTKLGIYDTSGGSDRLIALFSKDEGLITSLTAQDEFTLQRYENSDSATRFIPTATGTMITVNDS